MASYEDGYLQALFDVKAAVREMAGGEGISSEGMAELLDVTSFLDKQIRSRITSYSDESNDDDPANENVEERS